MVKWNPEVHFLLLGDGPLRHDMMQRVETLGLNQRIHFPGARPDVPRLMKGAMDAFLCPSHFEGGPWVLLEAQSAGLPCVYSECAAEPELIPGLLRRMSLAEPAERWSDAVMDLLQTCPEETRAAAFQQVEATPFNVLRSIRDLENLYFNAVATKHHAFTVVAN